MMLDAWLLVLSYIGLLVLAALFSAFEAALAATSRTSLHELDRRGNRRATAVLKILGRSESVLGSTLLAKLLAEFAATAVLIRILTEEFGTMGIFYGAAAQAAVVLVLVELLPKALAALAPDRLAMTLAPGLWPILAPFGAFVLAVESVIRRMAAALGVKFTGGGFLSVRQELRGTIDLHHSTGIVVKHDRDMLGGILDLSELEVSDVMVHRTKMLSFDISRPVDRMLEDILKSGHTRIPIWKDQPDNIVGILNAKDLFSEFHKHNGDAAKVSVEDIMSPPWFVPDTRPLSDQLNAFLRRRSHFAIVVDEYGEMMGIVTLEDIIEEIVGDISDEHDTVAAGIRPQKDGSYIIDGTIPIRDINRILEWSLPDEEATTIAGLVIHEARMIPAAGQAFTFHGFRFEVVRKRRHQITALRVTPLGDLPKV